MGQGNVKAVETTLHGKPLMTKANVRSYANVYQRRGKLIPQPCEGCGSPEVEKHHDDYGAPLQVRWLCKTCHMAAHGLARASKKVVGKVLSIWGTYHPSQHRSPGSQVCSRCGGRRDRSKDQRYCTDCQRAYQREWKRLGRHLGATPEWPFPRPRA